MTDDEIRVWIRALAACGDVGLAAKVVDVLARSGREFRPNAGQFAAEYRAREPHRNKLTPGPSQIGTAVDPRSPKEWIAEARRMLSEAPVSASRPSGGVR